MSEQGQQHEECRYKINLTGLGYPSYEDAIRVNRYHTYPCREKHEEIFFATVGELVGWELELSSLRAEVERMRAKVEQRDRLLDRFTANNIKLNQELEKVRAALSKARKEG